MPTFSVIVPTYNRADLLPRCLDSVLRQTFQDFELIVADDGSTDGTRDVVEDVVARDARVRYAFQDNRGGGDARNLGASVSTGRLITFIDSDDEVAPTWLQRFYEAFGEPDDAIDNCECREGEAPAEPGVGPEDGSTGASPSQTVVAGSSVRGRSSLHVVCCGQRLMDHHGELKKISLPKTQGLFISGSFAMRREAFDAVGGYVPGLPASQHTELKYRLLPLCERSDWRIASIEEPLAIRHLHNGSSIRTNHQAVYESCLYILREHEQFLRVNPRNYANWATLCAMTAVQIKRFTDARVWLRRAVRTCPGNWRNYARLAVVSIPLLRSVAWRKSPNTDL